MRDDSPDADRRAALFDPATPPALHRALPQRSREGLLNCIAGLIDHRYEGRVTKRYLTELRVSRTLPRP